MKKNEKLEKSVTVPAPKARSPEGPLVAVAILLAVSLMGNFILFIEYGRAAESKEDYARNYFARLDENVALREKLEGMKDDIKELTSDEAATLHVTDERSRQDFKACMKQPDGILVTPWALGMPYWELKLHNTEPLLSTSPDGDYWFTPGSACSLDRGAAVRITRWEDLYILQPWNPPTGYRSYATCPDAAFHLVSDTNVVVRNAVFRACLTKIKERDIRAFLQDR
jgi:hypothetical protein